MSTINEKFFDDLSKGATWSAGVAFKRSNPLPLDRYSVFASKAEATTYATTNAVAYPGQVIAVVEENKMGVYVLAQKATYTEVEGQEEPQVTYSLDLQEISPEIDLSEYVTFDDLEKAIEEIVIPQIPNITASDDDVVDVTAEGHNITVSHAKKGPENKFVGTTEADEVTTFGGSATIKVPKVTVDEYGHVNAVEEKEFKVAIPALPEDQNTEYTLEYVSKEVTEGESSATKKFIQLKDDSGAVISEIDASEFIKDGMLTDVAYEAENNTLTFVWNTDSGIKTDTVELSNILDPYTAGAKIVINGTEISHAEIETEDVTNGEEITTRKYIAEIQTDGYGHITGYKTAEEKVVDTDTTYTISGKIEGEGKGKTVVLTPSEGEATEVVLDVYTKEETYTKTEVNTQIEQYVEKVTGGESAGEVLGKLENYQEAIDNEIWGTEVTSTWVGEDEDGAEIYAPNYQATSRIDTIENKLSGIQEGAQVNLIDFIDENNFTLGENKKLMLKGVTNLSEALNEKLTKTDVNENHFTYNDGKLTLVKDYEDGAEVNFIQAVDTNVFEVKDEVVGQDEDGADILKATLNLVSVPATSLTEALGDLSKLPNAATMKLVDEINNIYEILSWGDIA